LALLVGLWSTGSRHTSNEFGLISNGNFWQAEFSVVFVYCLENVIAAIVLGVAGRKVMQRLFVMYFSQSVNTNN
jgi:hypothetical protein